MAKTTKRRRSGGLVGRLSERFTPVTEVGGGIDPGTRQIDPKGALLLESVAVAEVGMEREGQPGELVLAVELRGKVSGKGAEVHPLVLGTPDGMALLIAQMLTVAQRGRFGAEFSGRLAARLEEAAAPGDGQ